MLFGVFFRISFPKLGKMVLGPGDGGGFRSFSPPLEQSKRKDSERQENPSATSTASDRNRNKPNKVPALEKGGGARACPSIVRGVEKRLGRLQCLSGYLHLFQRSLISVL